VPSISERDAAALLEVVGELARLDDPLPFPPRFLGRLALLIGTDQAWYSENDRRNEASVLDAGWLAGSEFVFVGDHDEGEAYWRLRHSHPLCSWRERTGDWTTPHTVSEFATLREFHRTEIWNESYRPEGIDYWLDVGLPVRGGRTRVFIFPRGGHDFGARERLLLELLEPHLERRERAAATTAAAVDALVAVEEAGDEARTVVLAGARGTIEFASPRSRALLAEYFGTTNGTLPTALLRPGTVVAHAESRRLTVRIARVVGLIVALLGEEDERVERLTPRQGEILRLVAAGLTDAQIADRLGIATGTVNKHLEAVYERLDVHTRTAAAALCHG
jgi:DNA-binding CsgD family transcriptional regulator